MQYRNYGPRKRVLITNKKENKTCDACGGALPQGARIWLHKENKRVWHDGCVGTKTKRKNVAVPQTFHAGKAQVESVCPLCLKIITADSLVKVDNQTNEEWHPACKF